MNHRPYVLGVDLGTTSTAAAVMRDGEAHMLDLSSLDPAIPSVLWLGENGSFLIGPAAEGRAIVDPSGVAREFKRRFGDPQPLLLRGSPFSADDLSLRLLRFVVDKASEALGGVPDRMVVCHPANWGPFKLSLLSDAIANSSLPRTTLLPEPEAAAIHYATSERIDVGAIVAVYDLGGGTFDVAFLRRTSGSWEPVGKPGGIERLGGVDFDTAIFGRVLEMLDIDPDDLEPEDEDLATAGAQLRRDCIEAKKTLSSNTAAEVPIYLPGHEGSVRITRMEFESLIRPSLDRSVVAFSEAIHGAGLTAEQVERVLLVGGSSRIPVVAQTVGLAIGRDVFVDVHPKFVVALGAAQSIQPFEPPAAAASVAADQPEPSTIATQTSTDVKTTALDRVDLPPLPPTVPEGARRPRLATRIMAGTALALAFVTAVFLISRNQTGSDDVAAASGDASAALGDTPNGFVDVSQTALGNLGLANNNQVYAARGPQAEPIRRWGFAEPFFSPPIVTPETVFGLTVDAVVAINVDDGRVLWSKERDGNFAHMALTDEALYVTGLDETSSWIDIYDRVDGTALRLGLALGGWDAGVGPQRILVDGQGLFLLVALEPGSPDEAPTALIRFDPTTGEILWQHDRVGYGNDANMVLIDGLIVTLSDNEILAVDADTGRQQWTATRGATPLSTLTGEPGTVIVQSTWFGEGGTFAIEPSTGEQRWELPSVGNQAVVDNGIVYTIRSDKTVVARDIIDRSEIWSASLPGDFFEFTADIAADDITLYIVNDEQLGSTPRMAALDRSDGSLIWEVTLSGERWFSRPGPVSVAGGSLIVQDNTGALSAWS